MVRAAAGPTGKLYIAGIGVRYLVAILVFCGCCFLFVAVGRDPCYGNISSEE
jgi:hypothetical protein